MLWYCRWGGGLRSSWGSLRGRSIAAPRAVRPWSRDAPGRWGARGLRQQQQQQNRFPLDLQVPRAVLLFQHERRRFFGLLGLFCTAQFTFWAYLAHVAFHTLRDTSQAEQKEQALEETLLNLGSKKWRYGFSISCLTVGSLILLAGYLFSRRSVSRILLHRGGQEVSFTTYYLFGLTSSFTVPLRHVSCMSHRSEVPAMIPLKVKGRRFYFLLDKEGHTTNATLFDITVGAYRRL